jgi:hypothetical protein
MLVAPERAVTLDRGGETIYFCALGCLAEYESGTYVIPPTGIVATESED